MYCNWLLPALLVASGVVLPAQARPFGQTCDGHLPASPTLRTSAPTIAGATFDLEIDAVAGNRPFFLVVGTSNTTWSGQSLPLDVGFLGLPGCFLNVSYDWVFGLGSDATGKRKLPIQTAGIPAGMRLFTQVVVPEPAGYRVATSPGYELTLAASVPDFSLVAIPDTQTYVIYGPWAQIFGSMTQWVVDHLKAENIKFVSHVGDVVLDGAIGVNQNQAEWDFAAAAMSKLDGDLNVVPDGLVPYSVGVGNRDYDIIHAKSSWQQYTKHFGASHFSGRSWYGGTGPDGLNRFQVFDADGDRYLHLALEWRPRDQVLTWAQGVLAAHPELPTILTTHQYLNYSASGFDDSGATPNGGGDNGALGVRHKLVEPFPQVFLVLCGHNPGGTHRSDTTVLGQTVHSMLMDYSFDRNGGNGWMNKLVCSPDRGLIESDCFSPYYVPGTTSGVDRNTLPGNNGVFAFDFHLHRRMLETTTTLRFTGGHDHGHGLYTGSQDTFVAKSAPTTAVGTGVDIHSDHGSPASEEQGLIRFGGLFGPASGQVPRSKPILCAILTLTTEGPGAASATSSGLFRLRVPFDEKSTWASLVSGIQVGVETEPAADAVTGSSFATAGTRSLDVTASLRAWQTGAPNHGWAVIHSGSDRWQFRSQDWGTAAERPMLTVIYQR